MSPVDLAVSVALGIGLIGLAGLITATKALELAVGASG